MENVFLFEVIFYIILLHREYFIKMMHSKKYNVQQIECLPVFSLFGIQHMLVLNTSITIEILIWTGFYQTNELVHWI